MKGKLKNNKQAVIGIVLLVVMVIGFSYAWFQLTLRGEKENVLKAGTLSLVLDDTMGDGISIENGVPVTDEDGQKTVPYTFTLENNGTLDSDYTIYLDDLDLLEGETRMPDSAIKYYLTKDGSDLGLDLLSTTGENPNRVLDSGVIAAGEKYTYTLRLWIDYDAGNEVMGTTFRGQIRVEAIQAAPKAFAVYSEDDNSLKFYKSSNIPEVGSTYNNLLVTEVYTNIETTDYEEEGSAPWTSKYESIASVEFVDVISPISTARWFSQLSVPIDLTNLDMSNVKNVSSMYAAYGLEMDEINLDLTGLDVSNVEDMSGMFNNVGGFSNSSINIDVTGWDLSNVVDMSDMFIMYFGGTYVINGLDSWNTSNVENMSMMFGGVYIEPSAGDGIDLSGISNWDLSSVTDMSNMFSSNFRIKELDLSGWDTTAVANKENMFVNCPYFEKVTFGATSANLGGYLPIPDSSNIDGADGNWYNKETSVAYLPEAIPNDTAATYVASPNLLQ